MKLIRIVSFSVSFAALALVLTGCDPSVPHISEGTEAKTPTNPDRESPFPESADGGVVKARAKLNLLLGADGNGKGEILSMALEPLESLDPEVEIFAGSSAGSDVSVTLPVSTSYSLDVSGFIASPPLSNAVVSFGTLAIGSTFYDNNVKVCGASQNGECTRASIRAYTTQAASVSNPGDGLWNAKWGYGVPLTIRDASGVAQLIQLGQANSKLLHGFNFTGSKRVLTFSDWQALSTFAPNYAVSADFTLAGAGIYSATIVLDYVLN